MSLPKHTKQSVRGLLDCMTKHELTVLCSEEAVTVCRLGIPNSNHLSVILTFLRGAIGLTGDLRFESDGRQGVWSMPGYGIGWFASPLSSDYLCSKFLIASYDSELTAASLFSTYLEAKMDAAEELDPARRAAMRWRLWHFRDELEDATFATHIPRKWKVKLHIIKTRIEALCSDQNELGDFIDSLSINPDIVTPHQRQGLSYEAWSMVRHKSPVVSDYEFICYSYANAPALIAVQKLFREKFPSIQNQLHSSLRETKP
jgi:hypothetical protein